VGCEHATRADSNRLGGLVQGAQTRSCQSDSYQEIEASAHSWLRARSQSRMGGDMARALRGSLGGTYYRYLGQ
jgi:hypothetical protein